MAEVRDVQVQPVSEHVFYIGSVLVKFSSTAEPKEEAIKPNFRTPPCSWFFVGKNSNSGSTWQREGQVYILSSSTSYVDFLLSPRSLLDQSCRFDN